mmetsp:Transcript_23824/g.46949  ORF Transcript_23824/g.46949 Transcript_23824/m.46949 type:complete len:80 (+) Transcript_23824:289-528(+)
MVLVANEWLLVAVAFAFECPKPDGSGRTSEGRSRVPGESCDIVGVEVQEKKKKKERTRRLNFLLLPLCSFSFYVLAQPQ